MHVCTSTHAYIHTYIYAYCSVCMHCVLLDVILYLASFWPKASTLFCCTCKGRWLVCLPVAQVMPSVHPDRIHFAQSFPWVLFGLTVIGVLQDVSLTACSRDLDVAEIFCGVGSIWLAGKTAGYNAAGFDKWRVPGVTDSIDSSACEDILSPAGFLNAVRLVLRLKVHALLWLAPMCNSFCFLNLSRTNRKAWNSFVGNTALQYVCDGNLGAQVAAFLMTLAFVRDVDAVLESPHDSRIFAMFRHASVLGFCNIRSSCMRCPFDVEPDGKRIWKRYIFLSFCSWVRRLRRKCCCVSKTHIKSTKKRFGRVTGVPALLRKGGAYPPALGTEIISAWELREASGSYASPPKRRRRKRRLSRQASLASSSHIMLSNDIENDGGLVFEASEDCAADNATIDLSGAGLAACSPSLDCESPVDSDGAGLAARSPSLACESPVDSNGAGLTAHSPSVCCDSHEDAEQASLHLDSMSESGVEFSGSE